MSFQSLFVRHDRTQDRVLLVVRFEQTERTLHLTRRLAFELLGALSRQIRKTQGDESLAPSGLENELLSMKHASAVSHVRQAQAALSPPPAPEQRLAPRLVTKIDIHQTARGRLMIFASLEGEIGRLALTETQLHWFVGRLVHHCGKAGWGDPMPVPDWLDNRALEDAATAQAKGRPLH